jgi:hypothetical protein
MANLARKSQSMKGISRIWILSCWLGPLLAFSNNASAGICDDFKGTRITPTTFDSTKLLLQSAAVVKGEFEISADFEVRRSAVQRRIPASVIMTVPFNPQYAVYNADARLFQIKSQAIRNLTTPWRHVFSWPDTYRDPEIHSYSTVDLVLSESLVSNGTYVGQNSYGATRTVERVTLLTKAIFERKADGGIGGLFGTEGPDSSRWPSWSIPALPDQARTMKDRFRAAVIIAPQNPYYFEKREPNALMPTIDSPYNTSIVTQVIHADIKCVLITSELNLVLLAIPTS